MPIIPNVTTTTAVAFTSGQVPDPDPNNFLGALITDADPVVVNDGTASVADSVSSIATGGAETSTGGAHATVDAADFFGGSTYGASSEVSTSDSGTPTNGPTGFLGLPFNMTNQSLAVIDAVLNTTGLIGVGETGTVDAVLDITGSLIYEDPTGTASATEVVDPFDPTMVDIVPDMETSFSISFLVGDAVDATTVDPESPPVASVFSGSATLESILGGDAPGTTPVFSTSGDLSVGDFTQIGTCDEFFCQYDIDISIVLSDIQSLGFGEELEAGLLLLTSVEGVSNNTGTGLPDSGIHLVSDFDQTASFGISINVQPAAAASEPASAAVLALGLAILGATRRSARRGR
jgi:hypothetical protein